MAKVPLWLCFWENKMLCMWTHVFSVLLWINFEGQHDTCLVTQKFKEKCDHFVVETFSWHLMRTAVRQDMDAMILKYFKDPNSENDRGKR